jgi:hypothetical protein
VLYTEDMLSCKPVKRRARVKGLFKTVEDFMKEKSVNWPYCVEVRKAAAHSMEGNKRPQGLIEQPETMFLHCMLHRDSLANEGIMLRAE